MEMLPSGNQLTRRLQPLLILQLLPAGSKVGGRGEEKVMMINWNQIEKATRGPNKQRKPTHILPHSPTNPRPSGPPRRYRRCMTIDNRNITRGSEQPLYLYE